MEQEKKQQNRMGKIEPLQTYSSDMAEAVRINEASVIKIALAEQRKREQEELYTQAGGSKTKKFFWALGGAIFILGAIASSFILIQKKNAEENPSLEIPKNIEAFVSYDDQAYIDVTNVIGISDLSTSINTEVEKLATPGFIKTFFLTTTKNGKRELVSLSELFKLIKTTTPTPLARSLNETFMVGAYLPTTPNAHPHLFLILNTNDYNIAYAGMLEWEKTIFNDMFVLFKTEISEQRGNLFEKPFKDIIIDNRDARILYDVAGIDVLYYIFPTKDMLVITDNKDTIKEITTRLLIKKTKPL